MADGMGAEDARSRWLSSADRKARRDWARRSSDRAIRRLADELARKKEEKARILDSLLLLMGSDSEVLDKLLAVVPAL